MLVGMAQPGGRHPQEEFALAGQVHLQLVDLPLARLRQEQSRPAPHLATSTTGDPNQPINSVRSG